MRNVVNVGIHYLHFYFHIFIVLVIISIPTNFEILKLGINHNDKVNITDIAPLVEASFQCPRSFIVWIKHSNRHDASDKYSPLNTLQTHWCFQYPSYHTEISDQCISDNFEFTIFKVILLSYYRMYWTVLSLLGGVRNQNGVVLDPPWDILSLS
jgi:hypothetical protein